VLKPMTYVRALRITRSAELRLSLDDAQAAINALGLLGYRDAVAVIESNVIRVDVAARRRIGHGLA
jgi:hypothetical protein